MQNNRASKSSTHFLHNTHISRYAHIHRQPLHLNSLSFIFRYSVANKIIRRAFEDKFKKA